MNGLLETLKEYDTRRVKIPWILNIKPSEMKD